MKNVEYPSNVKFCYFFNKTRHFAFTIAYRPVGCDKYECGVSYHCSTKQNLSRRQGRMVAYNRLISQKEMGEKYKFVFYYDSFSKDSLKGQMLFALAKNSTDNWVIGLIDKGLSVLNRSAYLEEEICRMLDYQTSDD